jgi:hypothetical protein
MQLFVRAWERREDDIVINNYLISIFVHVLCVILPVDTFKFISNRLSKLEWESTESV